MPELNAEQTAALIHWSAFGRPGEPVTERFVPDEDERSRARPFVHPASAAWDDVFDDEQTQRLLRGFPRGEMEDKWVIWSDDVTVSATTSVHFHRSWTGSEVVRVELQLTRTGSRLTRGWWETDETVVKGSSEEFARETFVECCAWVLGMPLTR